MSVRDLLFVHSPLVGPSSLERLAERATARGHQVALPDLTSVASASRPHDEYVSLAAAAAAQLGPAVTVIGHSGAGVFLPAIGHRLGSSSTLVFVDAVVPPETGAHTPSAAMRRVLDEQAVDGELPPWLTWWPDEIVAELLPDEADRRRLLADMPRLPLGFYERDVPVPAGWSSGRCAYLRLSGAYDSDIEAAARRGWPTASSDSTHLGVHTAPDRVLDAAMLLAERVDPATS